LNEAKGYNYLVRIGCTNVSSVSRSLVPGKKTPDLQGSLGATKVLCEVKTINISEDEAARRKSGAAGSTLADLPDGIFKKLKSDLDTAGRQMTTYCPATGVKRIAYVIVNYDDSLHEYAPEYSKQIAALIATNPVPELEIFFDIKPPYYSAMA
jgi:hypothetical protein